MAYAPFHIPLMFVVVSPLYDLSIADDMSNKRDKFSEIDRKGNIRYYDQKQEEIPMEPIFYTVMDINGDYAQLAGDQGQEHSITMFLLPEGTTVGSRLKLENFIWSLEA